MLRLRREEKRLCSPSRTTPRQGKDCQLHFVVMEHGFLGSHKDLEYFEEALEWKIRKEAKRWRERKVRSENQWRSSSPTLRRVGGSGESSKDDKPTKDLASRWRNEGKEGRRKDDEYPEGKMKVTSVARPASPPLFTPMLSTPVFSYEALCELDVLDSPWGTQPPSPVNPLLSPIPLLSSHGRNRAKCEAEFDEEEEEEIGVFILNHPGNDTCRCFPGIERCANRLTEYVLKNVELAVSTRMQKHEEEIRRQHEKKVAMLSKVREEKEKEEKTRHCGSSDGSQNHRSLSCSSSTLPFLESKEFLFFSVPPSHSSCFTKNARNGAPPVVASPWVLGEEEDNKENAPYTVGHVFPFQEDAAVDVQTQKCGKGVKEISYRLKRKIRYSFHAVSRRSAKIHEQKIKTRIRRRLSQPGERCDDKPGWFSSCWLPSLISSDDSSASHPLPPISVRWKLVFHWIGYSLGGLIIRAALPDIMNGVMERFPNIPCTDRKAHMEFPEMAQQGTAMPEKESGGDHNHHVSGTEETTALPLSFRHQFNVVSQHFFSLCCPHLGARHHHPAIKNSYYLVDCLDRICLLPQVLRDLMVKSDYIDNVLLGPRYLKVLAECEEKVFFVVNNDRMVWNYSGGFVLPPLERHFLDGHSVKDPVVDTHRLAKSFEAPPSGYSKGVYAVDRHSGWEEDGVGRGGKEAREPAKEGRTGKDNANGNPLEPTGTGTLPNFSDSFPSPSFSIAPWLTSRSKEAEASRWKQYCFWASLGVYPATNLDELSRNGVWIHQQKTLSLPFPFGEKEIAKQEEVKTSPSETRGAEGNPQRKGIRYRSFPRTPPHRGRLAPYPSLHTLPHGKVHHTNWVNAVTWPESYLPVERRMAEEFLQAIGPVELHVIDLDQTVARFLKEYIDLVSSLNNPKTDVADENPDNPSERAGFLSSSHSIHSDKQEDDHAELHRAGTAQRARTVTASPSGRSHSIAELVHVTAKSAHQLVICPSTDKHHEKKEKDKKDVRQRSAECRAFVEEDPASPMSSPGLSISLLDMGSSFSGVMSDIPGGEATTNTEAPAAGGKPRLPILSTPQENEEKEFSTWNPFSFTMEYIVSRISDSLFTEYSE